MDVIGMDHVYFTVSDMARSERCDDLRGFLDALAELRTQAS